MKLAEEIYNTVAVGVVPECRVPGVEYAFEEGAYCMELYGQMLEAYQSLCQRLGVVDVDDDAEIMISSLLEIQRELCLKMYSYGVKFGKE